MQTNFQHHPLGKLFSGLVEHAFGVEVGVADPRLTDYLVRLLLEFIHVDRLYKIRDAEGHRIDSIAAMLAAARERTGAVDPSEARDMHRHIGDFALFWAGVFPEGLHRRSDAVNPDHLVDYVDRGKESYYIASELFREDSDPPGSLFRRLSTEFEVCAHGLGLVRRRWESRGFEAWDGDPNLLY